MKKLLLLLVVIVVLLGLAHPSDTIPGPESEAFSNEEQIHIRGYTDHAMEPFISRDGKYLFWNNLNDGIHTSIFYAERIDDLNFRFIGEVMGVNGIAPHLDAVASMDSAGNFYWVSTRNYSETFENLLRGYFHDGVVTEWHTVPGNIHKKKLGWLIMDAEISANGDTLLFANARFTGAELPAESDIYIAEKKGEDFMTRSDSKSILKNINTSTYLEYAPTLSADGTELLFSRLSDGVTHIYISTRDSLDEAFGIPQPLKILGDLPEGPSLSLDGDELYYHKKSGDLYKIYRMTRNTDLDDLE